MVYVHNMSLFCVCWSLYVRNASTLRRGAIVFSGDLIHTRSSTTHLMVSVTLHCFVYRNYLIIYRVLL